MLYHISRLSVSEGVCINSLYALSAEGAACTYCIHRNAKLMPMILHRFCHALKYANCKK